MAKLKPPMSWGVSTVETACTLDCPDSCSLAVSVEKGRVTKIDGANAQATTKGYICNKVRHFDERVYGPDRLRFPGVRKGPKGAGAFKRVQWDEALDLIAQKMVQIRATHGAEAILPFYYGGSNGLLTQDTADAELFRAFGASRLARTVCAAPTGAASLAAYGKMAGVSYLDYPEAKLIVIWGANPSASGIHLVPFLYDAQRNGATLVVVDPRRTPLAKRADLHLAIRPGTDLPVALAIHRFLFETGRADRAFLEAHTRGADELRAKAAPWTIDAAAAEAGIDAAALERFAELYASTSPAVVRCGWGLERNRNGGSAALAVIALPAVAGRFGVRGGGYTLSNSSAFGLKPADWIRTPEPATRVVNMNHLGRALLEYTTPPVQMLFVYNCNPLATMPDQNRVVKGLEREDLFTVVFDQVMTDSAKYADVVLPATTFLEHYDVAKGYGAISLQLVRPVIDAYGESRPNVEVFGDLSRRLGLGGAGVPAGEPVDEIESEPEALLRLASRMPEPVRDSLMASGSATPPHDGRPIQFVDVFPLTPDRRIDLFPGHIAADAPAGLYGYQPDPATDAYPLTLISPASDKTISSTLGELADGTAALQIHPTDAADRLIEAGDTVRVHNERGEVQCLAAVTDAVRAGTVCLPKGLWRKSTLNGSTANALAPDTLSDLGAGACFNDARVEVVRVVTARIEKLDVALWVADRVH
jgi:anaerobic selenocysteine-containing dehydrogenase